jgi:hypothetical protein
MQQAARFEKLDYGGVLDSTLKVWHCSSPDWVGGECASLARRRNAALIGLNRNRDLRA